MSKFYGTVIKIRKLEPPVVKRTKIGFSIDSSERNGLIYGKYFSFFRLNIIFISQKKLCIPTA